MRRALPLLLAVLLALPLLAGCAGSGGTTASKPPVSTFSPTTTTSPPRTTAPTGTEPEAQTQLSVYFLRAGEVGTARRTIAATPAIGSAALNELVDGPSAAERSAGLTTAIPSGATLRRLTIADGVARLDLSGGLSHEAIAQVVYTLTQFPSVRAVQVGDQKLTRASFEDVTPAIFVESPAPGQAVASPMRIRGTANTFEATFLVELLLDSDGRKAFQRVVTATSGSGTRGTFDVTIPFESPGAGPARLVAYEASAKDGSPIHTVEIPVEIGP